MIYVHRCTKSPSDSLKTPGFLQTLRLLQSTIRKVSSSKSSPHPLHYLIAVCCTLVRYKAFVPNARKICLFSDLTRWLSTPELHPTEDRCTLGKRVLQLFEATAEQVKADCGALEDEDVGNTPQTTLTPELNLLYLPLHTAPPNQVPPLLTLASKMWGVSSKEEERVVCCAINFLEVQCYECIEKGNPASEPLLECMEWMRKSVRFGGKGCRRLALSARISGLALSCEVCRENNSEKSAEGIDNTVDEWGERKSERPEVRSD